LTLRSSGMRRPEPKTFSRGPMPRCDLERAVGAFCGRSPRAARCSLGCWPAGPGLGAGCGLGRVVCVCIMASLLAGAEPGPNDVEVRLVDDCESKSGSW
jgi:hypothetical protein